MIKSEKSTSMIPLTVALPLALTGKRFWVYDRGFFAGLNRYSISRRGRDQVDMCADGTETRVKGGVKVKELFNIIKRLETLDELRTRTQFVYEPQFGGGFTVSPSVGAKVAPEDGALLPYAGSTVVLTLPEPARNEIEAYQRALYYRAGWCLSRPLPAESFHITLHDLESGTPSPELEARIGAVRENAKAIAGEIAASGQTVCLRSTRVYCMAGTSLVLGFEPEDTESCRLLMAAYALLERIRPLDYPLTPHVTLGYLRPLKYTRGHLEALRAAVEACGRMAGVYLELPLSAVEYEAFSDMRTYWRA